METQVSTQVNTNEGEVEIDLLHLIKVLWKKAWIIFLSTILCGAIALGYSLFFITPQFESKAMMYFPSIIGLRLKLITEKLNFSPIFYYQ